MSQHDAATSESIPDPASPLRVLQLGVTLSIGGSEQLAASIGRGLDRSAFHSVFAATGNDGDIGQLLRNEGFHTEVYDRPLGFTPRLYWEIDRVLRRERIDIIQTHHVSSLVYGGPPARLRGVKIVHTEHETKTFDRYPRNLRWLRWMAPMVHRFVAIDPEIADFLADRIGIDRSRIEVIRNGIDLDRFDSGTRPVKSPDADWVIGWISRLDVPKRPDLLVDAIAKLANRFPRLRGRIVGPGSLLDETKRRAAAAGLDGRIECVGARTDIPDQLRTMDCFVLCSEREGLPISLVEAMASRLPCIVSPVGAIPTLIQSGENGILLSRNEAGELAEHLADVITKPERAAQLGNQARASVAERYDLKETISRYSELFTRLAARKR